jgi:hypothetical protein
MKEPTEREALELANYLIESWEDLERKGIQPERDQDALDALKLSRAVVALSATAPSAREVANRCAEIAKPKSDNPETTWERGYWAAQNGIWRDILKLITTMPKVKE